MILTWLRNPFTGQWQHDSFAHGPTWRILEPLPPSPALSIAQEVALDTQPLRIAVLRHTTLVLPRPLDPYRVDLYIHDNDAVAREQLAWLCFIWPFLGFIDSRVKIEWKP